MTLTYAIIDHAVVDNFRVGVWYDRFDTALNTLKRALPVVSFNVDYRRMLLGDRDATTGWRTVTYDTADTRDMLMINPSTRANIFTVSGLLSSYSVAGLTADPVYLGDRVNNEEGVFEIVNIKIHALGDSFLYRECELEHLPAHEVV